ncbi:MAG: four helix bundle protein [Alistipes sp.]
MVGCYKDLIVWQRSMVLAKNVYEIVKLLPKEEQFGLSSQMRRAAISIPSNIAEGQARNSSKEFKNFLSVAKGSAAELETQLLLCVEIGYCAATDIDTAVSLLAEVVKMINAIQIKIIDSQ